MRIVMTDERMAAAKSRGAMRHRPGRGGLRRSGPRREMVCFDRMLGVSAGEPVPAACRSAVAVGHGEDGFFGWHMQAPYDTSEVKTVFVYFKTQTFRRDLQLMLTEAVTKEINMRTPFRVVGKPEQADSILKGVITVTDKNLVVEAPRTCRASSTR